MGPLLILLLALPSAAVAGEISTSRATRRLRSFSEKEQHIWGLACEQNWRLPGCNLKTNKCSDYLSEGPDGADIEIKIGELPSSTSSNPVHLQWWSPRKSEKDYSPLEGPFGSTIYQNVLDAYPKYDDQEFNGGNVRVSESGEAVIRVQAPATYVMGCRRTIVTPHVHLRLCSNESYVHDKRDAVFFTTEGPYITSGCKNNGENYKILAYRKVSDSTWTLPASDLSTTSTTPSTTTASPATSFPHTAADGDVLVDMRVQSAREALDLDALEFSPVYYCFLKGMFYDHFSAACAKTCPEGSEVHHGQCVRPETSRLGAVTLKASWRLMVQCGSRCWDEKKNEKLHYLRLAAAEHLDVPFQEVAKVALEIVSDGDAAAGRRLSTMNEVKLSVIVVSRRVTADDEAALRNGFIPDVNTASDLIGNKVHSFEAKHDEAGDVVASEIDPYAASYEAIEKEGPSPVLVDSPTSFLPFEALLGGAAGAILLFVGMAVYIYRKRQSQKKQQEASVVAAKVAELEADKLGASDAATKTAMI